MKNDFENRSFLFEVRAEENEKHGKFITGRPIVYERWTDIGYFDEVICRGALDGADLTDVRFLVNHDTSKIPLARSRKNTANSTMQLSVDYEGLAIRVNVDTENNADARALYSAVQRGDITGMSFMFTIDGQRWEDLESEHPKRFIEKVGSVIEVSAVTFPAYEDTEINARDKAAVETARRELENARSQTVETVSDDDIEKMKIRCRILGGKK